MSLEPDWDRRKFDVYDQIRRIITHVPWYESHEEDRHLRPPRHEHDKKIRLDLDVSAEELSAMVFGSPRPRAEDILDLGPRIPEILKPRFIDIMSRDITDLFIDGDTYSADPMLKTMDGERKLGIRFNDIHIAPFLYYSQFSPMRDTFEYTFFTLIRGS